MNGLARWGWLLGFQEQDDGSQGAQVQNRKLSEQLLTHCGAELTAHTSEGTAMSSLGLHYSQSDQPPKNTSEHRSRLVEEESTIRGKSGFQSRFDH